MRISLPLILLLLCLVGPPVYASKPNKTALPGQVLVKLKPSFAYLNGDGKSMRSRHWKELVPELSIANTEALSTVAGAINLKQAKQARTGQKSEVDLRLYHQLSFDPGISIEQAVEQLYKSGIVAVAEPVYAAEPLGFTSNDPQLSSQYHHNLIKTYDAWSLSQGSEKVVIAILDTGVDLAHPDLAANIYLNEADTEDGHDTDGDGFLDNYYGWDFAGSDYRTIVGDNDPSTIQTNASHGTKVAGCASAVTNNGVGIAGVSFNAKLMVLKHVADNDTRLNGKGYLLNTIKGVLYAATHGADIVNASYGSTFYSQIEQDIYKLVAVDYHVLVVAAAGNSNNTTPIYPASYTHVLSVAASNSQDTKARISSYGYGVDLTAPGEHIFSTTVGGGYEGGSGTSFAAPLVSGAAALVKTKHPHLSGIQLGQLLRVAADTAFLTRLDATAKDKMGTGRLDLARALAYNGPAIRASNPQVIDALSGQEVGLVADFRNFLWPTSSDVSITLTSLSEMATVVEPVVVLKGLQTDELVSNPDKPFKLLIDEETPTNHKILLRLDFRSGDYKDVQHIIVRINPSYIDLQENSIRTTIAGNGRIGYDDSQREYGLGVIFNGANLLHEMGIIMAAGAGKVVNNVRAANGVDEDFQSSQKIRKAVPGAVADTEAWGSFHDGADSLNRLHVLTSYRTYSWKQAPYDKSVLLVYTIKNTGDSTLTDYFFGLYADWDIGKGSYRDKADWDSVNATGYVYSTDPSLRSMAAIQALSGKPSYWAIDNDHSAPDNPFGIYDGFTDKEKYLALSSGTSRTRAGQAAQGRDVSHTVGVGPYTIAAGDSVVVAFAVHAGTSLEELQSSAKSMKTLYEQVIRKTDTDNSEEEEEEQEDEEDTEEEEEEQDPVDEEEVTGLEDREIKNLRVFPNPTKFQLSVVLDDPGREPAVVRILDSSGRKLQQTSYPAGKNILQMVMPQSPGLYLLEISQGAKRSVRRVVVY